MGVNSYQGQITAASQPNSCFPANTSLMPLIIADYTDEVVGGKQGKTFYLQRIGIQAQPDTVVSVDNYKKGSIFPIQTNIKIGSTGIYEANDVQISDIKFVEDSSYDVIIDYIVKYFDNNN